jgi:hypothetical protein
LCLVRFIEAKLLTFEIVGDINSVTERNPNMSEDETENVEEAKRDVEALLAFLWTSAKGGLTVIHLADIPESGPQLNHQCELLRQKVKGGGTVPTAGGTIGVPTARTSEVATLTGAEQSLIMAMNANERIRRRKRREDIDHSSFLPQQTP